MVDLIERIIVLLKQESDFYTCEDYLAPSFQCKLARENDERSGNMIGKSSSSATSSSSSGINEVWREKICEWSYQVVDHFDFSREVVNISISFLDRYLATRTVDKKMFQLAAMTTLYLAVKIYEHGTLSMTSMIELSRGYFMVEQMAVMELSILEALSWHVHPPTAFCFARHLLHLCPLSESCPATARHDVHELARFLTELSVIDYFFVNKKSSYVGLAALLNAMEISRSVPAASRLSFIEAINLLNHINVDDPKIEECRQRLRELYIAGGYYQNHESPIIAAVDESRAETVSPVSIAASFGPFAYQPDHATTCAPSCRPEGIENY